MRGYVSQFLFAADHNGCVSSLLDKCGLGIDATINEIMINQC